MNSLMRQLLPATLHAALSPGALELALLDWRDRLLRVERIAIPDPGSDWQAVLGLLRQQLQTGAWQARALQVVLSSHFVRYCLLPGDARLARATEQTGYVRHMFRSEFGAAVDGWRVAADRAGSGARLACAADAGLLDELARVCAANRLRLRSVRPYLAVAANRVCRRITQPGAWLAVLEGDACALALLQSGRWRHVAGARLGAAAGVSLFALLRQQALQLPEADTARCVYVCGAPADLADAGDARGWRIETLTRAPAAARVNLLPF
jgi:hypothetical protein